MNLSESEIVALMAIAVLLNGVGLLAWRRGLLGHWYPIAIGPSMLALLADPMSLPGLLVQARSPRCCWEALASLCPSGTATAEPWWRLPASDPGKGSARGPSTLMARRVFG